MICSDHQSALIINLGFLSLPHDTTATTNSRTTDTADTADTPAAATDTQRDVDIQGMAAVLLAQHNPVIRLISSNPVSPCGSPRTSQRSLRFPRCDDTETQRSTVYAGAGSSTVHAEMCSDVPACWAGGMGECLFAVR